MAKMVKICPNCKYVNDRMRRYCENPDCREPLTRVDPVEIASTEAGSTTQAIDATPVHFEEPSPAPAAASVQDAPTHHASALPTARLECLSQPDFVFDVLPGNTIGRKGDIDICSLKDCMYISRLHALVTYGAGSWIVENLSETSDTVVNGKKLQPRDSTTLADGDRITLGTTPFLFRTGGG